MLDELELINSKPNKEMVIHPEHYNTVGRKECWTEMIEIFGDSQSDIILGEEAVIIFDMMSAYKYWYRAGEKDGNPKEQDLAKIDNYINHAQGLLIDIPAYCLGRKIYDVIYDKIKGDD